MECFENVILISLTVGFELTTTEREILFDTCTEMSCFDVSINDDDILEKEEAVHVLVSLREETSITPINSDLEIVIVDNENGDSYCDFDSLIMLGFSAIALQPLSFLALLKNRSCCFHCR